jgi:chromosome segregation ATPase
LDVDSTFYEGLGPVASQSSHGLTVSAQQGTFQSVGAGPFNDSAQISRGQFLSSENPSITSLKLQIKNLQQQLLTVGVSAAMSDERLAGKITGVGKVTSQRLQALETTIAKRDTSIGALKGEKEKLQADVADMQERLRGAESLVEKLTAEKGTDLDKLQNLVRHRADLQTELALANAEIQNVNESFQDGHGVLVAEIESLKLREAEGLSRIQNLVESLSRTANDAEVLREENSGLEILVSKYLVEAQENEGIAQRLWNEVKDKDTCVERLSIQLKTLNQSTEENLVRLSDKESIIKALAEETRSAQDEAKAIEETLAAKLDELRAEKDQRLQLVQQLADKGRALQAAQQTTSEVRLMNERLVSELTAKQGSIEQLSTEITVARRHATVAEDSLIESRRRYEEECAGLLIQVSDLQATVESAEEQNDAVTAILLGMQGENAKITLAVGEKEDRLTELQQALEMERRGNSALEAGMVSYIAKIQDLEAQLAEVKSARKIQEKRTFDLRNLFTDLRKSQEKLFDEFEGNCKVSLSCSYLFLCTKSFDFLSIIFRSSPHNPRPNNAILRHCRDLLLRGIFV